MTPAAAVRLDDDATLADLSTFVRRAARADPDGAARLVRVATPSGSALAVYVCPVHGGGPTVLGLRTFALAAAGGAGTPTPTDLDVVVPLAALTDRLARPARDAVLPLPPTQLTGVVWAGVSPPRSGWAQVGTVGVRELAEVAHRGITEVASGAPDVAGAAAVAALRGRVWGRPLSGSAAGLPAGAAFVAQVLGLLPAGDVDQLAVRAAGPWRRVSTSAGHVMSRPALLGA